MGKSKTFIQNLFKPFVFNSTRDENEVDLEKIAAQEQKHFSFEALVAATRKFDPNQKLGEGGFGPVFKGVLKDGTEIAVKRLSQRSGQGTTEFQNEAKLLARVQHKNVVNFVGYCVHGSERLLVYEYVANESLDKLLFSNISENCPKSSSDAPREKRAAAHEKMAPRDASPITWDAACSYPGPRSTSAGQRHTTKTQNTEQTVPGDASPNLWAVSRAALGRESDKRELLDWKRRHDVIAGVAKGLLYLHEQAHCSIIHRDIKASNILLDEKWVPKIADFGMARLYPEDETHVHTRVAGTNGYMAPEYLLHGNLSKKADVFSFGVVVLELISGQKNSTFNRDPDYDNLLEWIGLLCVQCEPQLRPDMDRVVMVLLRKPSNLEEPIRPGYPGSRYRRYRRATGSTITGTSDGSSSGSFGSLGSQSATLTASGSSFTGCKLDPHGKRPVKD
ncbi:hypothetical protein OROGR_010331 [Orobanche gracilis]